MPNSKILIGGEWRGVVSGETITVINPSTGEVFSQIGRGDAADIDLAVTAAQTGQTPLKLEGTHYRLGDAASARP